MPIAVVNLFIIWIILSVIYLGRPKKSTPTTSDRNGISEEFEEGGTSLDVVTGDSDQNVAKLLRRKLDELGPMTFHEKTVIVLITTAVILWLFRDPRVIPGWISIFPDTYPRIGDSTVAIAILIIMFIIPKEISYFSGGTDDDTSIFDWGDQFSVYKQKKNSRYFWESRDRAQLAIHSRTLSMACGIYRWRWSGHFGWCECIRSRNLAW